MLLGRCPVGCLTDPDVLVSSRTHPYVDARSMGTNILPLPHPTTLFGREINTQHNDICTAIHGRAIKYKDLGTCPRSPFQYNSWYLEAIIKSTIELVVIGAKVLIFSSYVRTCFSYMLKVLGFAMVSCTITYNNQGITAVLLCPQRSRIRSLSATSSYD